MYYQPYSMINPFRSGTTQSQTPGSSIIPQSISIWILSVFFRYLSYKIQLNHELFRSTVRQSISNQIQLYQYSQVSVLQDTTQSRTIPFNNTLVNLKPDTTLSVFPSLCLSFKPQSSGPSRLYMRHTIRSMNVITIFKVIFIPKIKLNCD